MVSFLEGVDVSSSSQALPDDEPLLRCDLNYEIWMLEQTYQRCPNVHTIGAVQDVQVRIKYNTLIESFAVHARNLAEFFLNEGGQKRKFTNKNYKINGPALIDIKDKVSGQISHLLSAHRKGKTKRPVERSERINDIHRANMYNILANEVRKFRAHLKQPYDNINIRALHPVNVPAESVGRQATTTASNSVRETIMTASPSITAAAFFAPPKQRRRQKSVDHEEGQ